MKKVIYSALLVFCGMLSMAAQDVLLLKTSGKVVIGDTTQITTPGSYNLYVQNGILTEKVKVSLRNSSEWADHAFANTPSIQQVENSISENSHLLEMPSADKLVQEGYELKAMDAKLLQQVEWLWQHTIQLQKENDKLRKRLEAIEQKQ